MAHGGWTTAVRSKLNLDARLNNVYRVVDGYHNVHVYADLDTVGFNYSSEDKLRNLIGATVNAQLGKVCSTEITAYTVSTQQSQPRMFQKLEESDIKVRPFERRYISCRGCKDDKKDREEREGRRREVPTTKLDLLEIELLADICLHAEDVRSVAERKAAIWIISNDPLFKTILFKQLKNRNMEVYSIIPEYMFEVPWYQDMTHD